MHPLDKKLLRDLWAQRGPVVTIGVVIALGIAGLTGFLGLHRELISTRADYYRQHRYAHVHLNLRRAPRAALAEVEALPGVEAAVGRISRRVAVDLPGVERRLSGRLVSLPEQGRSPVNRLRLLEGSLPAPGGVAEVVVLQDFARARGLRPGSRLQLVAERVTHEVRVAGIAMSPEFVYVIPDDGGWVPDPESYGIFWARRAYAERVFGMQGAFDDLVVRVGRGATPASMADQLERRLARFGVLVADERKDMPPYALLNNEIRLTLIRAWTIPSIFLLASALVLNLVLQRLVATQRVQIGTLKAIGLSNLAILRHYAGFALAIAALGAAGGAYLGWYLNALLLKLYRRFYQLPLPDSALHPDVVLGGVAVAVLAGAMGVLAAGSQVLALTPAVAMRPGPPETRASRAVAQLRALPLLWRLALRNMLRHPYRTLVSALGVMVGVAIMITSRFFTDGITEMNMFRFQVLQRQDVELSLARGTGAEALREVRRLPGVAAVERGLAYPVRLRKGRVSRRLVVDGVPRDAWMRRPRQRDGTPVPVPAEGLLVAEVVADLLGVRPGERIELETLDGKRIRTRVTVAGTYPSFLGLSAAADQAWLCQLVDEPHATTSAQVRLREDTPDLDRAIARRPGVVKATRRTEKVDAFRVSVQGPLDAATKVLVFLAGAIACGLTLNGALVALAERRSELAVLRVQGFYRGEVGDLLLHEHALIGLLGMAGGVPLAGALVAWVWSHVQTEILRLPFTIGAESVCWALLWALGYVLLAHLVLRVVVAFDDWRMALAVKE